jgi:hypothetical protein
MVRPGMKPEHDFGQSFIESASVTWSASNAMCKIFFHYWIQTVKQWK